MMCKPRSYYDEVNKVAIGYKNPLCLHRTRQVQPALYSGHVIVTPNHAPAIVRDWEETLEQSEISRKKMHDKIKANECVDNKVNITPPNYSKENFLATFKDENIVVVLQHKVAIGYKNPVCLARAKQAQSALYNGHVLVTTNSLEGVISVVKSEKSERLSEEAKRSDLKRFDSKEARPSTSGVNEPRHYTRRNALASTSTTLYDESKKDSVDEDDIVNLGNDGEIRNENLDDYFE
ncbi:hypothetical protein Tco_0753722 [Tanacetum coccineum]